MALVEVDETGKVLDPVAMQVSRLPHSCNRP